MIRLFFTTCCVLMILFRSYAQDYPLDLLQQYTKSKPDTARVHLLLKLSSYYLLKPLELQADLDSALVLAKEAKQLSRSLNYKQGNEESDFWIARTYAEAGDYSSARALLKSFSDTTRIKVMLQLADYKFHTQGSTKEDWDSAVFYANQSLEQSRSIRSIRLELESMVWLVEYYAFNKNLEKLNPFLMKTFAICRKSGYAATVSEMHVQVLKYLGSDKESYEPIKSLWKAALADCENDRERKNMLVVEQKILERISEGSLLGPLTILPDNGEGFFFRILELLGEAAEQSPACYANLCYVYYFKGDFAKSLSYGIKAEKLANKAGVDEMPVFANNAIGQVYFQRGNIDESINYLKKAITTARRKGVSPGGGTFKYLTRAFIAKNKPTEALALLEESRKDSATLNRYDKKDIIDGKGVAYMAIGNYNKAEQCFLECRELTKDMPISNQLIIDLALSRLYVQTEQYTKAKSYLDRLSKSENKGLEPLFVQEEVALLNFRVDSSEGNYKNAIAHLQENKLLHDSIFSGIKNRQFEEFKIQYETDKKDKDIQLKTLALQKTILLRNIFIGGAILFLLLLATIYNRYRKNQKTNNLLRSQQKQLQKLNEQQLKLLEEKDWLVKEIHHRVKNNLQIIMSLLNSQIAYIDNEPALTAIHDSQHRVHAMSLIHQKLYNSENLSSIDLSIYIRELVSYLSESFDARQRIRFELNIEPLKIDVSQAVPLGLILNEAITNSIKYAFPGDRNGLISISLSRTTSDNYLLTITDNGIGIPPGFTKTGSLGMSLMKGLSEDLDGTFSIENNNGTTIKISFVNEPVARGSNRMATSFVSTT